MRYLHFNVEIIALELPLFVPIKFVFKGTKIFKNLTDFSVCPKYLIGVKAVLKLWSQNLNSEYLTHFLMELPEFFFVLLDEGLQTSEQKPIKMCE